MVLPDWGDSTFPPRSVSPERTGVVRVNVPSWAVVAVEDQGQGPSSMQPSRNSIAWGSKPVTRALSMGSPGAWFEVPPVTDPLYRIVPLTVHSEVSSLWPASRVNSPSSPQPPPPHPASDVGLPMGVNSYLSVPKATMRRVLCVSPFTPSPSTSSPPSCDSLRSRRNVPSGPVTRGPLAPS